MKDQKHFAVTAKTPGDPKKRINSLRKTGGTGYNMGMQIGFIGLGKMGSRMALKLLKEGHDVVVWNRSPQPVADLKAQVPHVKSFATVKELVMNLEKPRVVWV